MPTDEPAAPRTVPDLLDAAVSRDPAATAVVDRDHRISYGELDARSSRLARRLAAHGIVAGTPVLVALPRSVDALVTWWALARLGAVFVPLGPARFPERQAYIAECSAARVGVTSLAERAGLPDTVEWFVHDDTADPGISAPITPRSARPHPDEPVHMAYSSGGTGVPKGIPHTHRTLTTLARAYRSRFRVEPSSLVLHIADPHHDAWLLELLLTFGSAATAVVVPPAVTEGEQLADFIRGARVTHAYLAENELLTLTATDLPDLRHLLLDARDLTEGLAEAWSAIRTLHLSYGVPGTTVTTSGPAGAGHAPTGNSRLIGTPVDGIAAYVLDDELHPVPFGTAGDLYLGGPALPATFHDRPDITSGRHVAIPFTRDAVPVLNTLDRVRWNHTPTGPALEHVEGPFHVHIRHGGRPRS
ncbi:MAG TPA: AMP-binding protein [Nocardia sp.]|uniref:AMP-binding protein n=1 Tax=Nocardia sp. TaxID=1821 RepID=UPI002B4B100D|nr:AMP-binding protein [Nocardia sp.]HLS77724.1 AMP-binding protein [Nocardia sp.]